MQKKRKQWLGPCASIGVFIIAVLVVYFGAADAARVAEEEGLRIAEQSVRRGAVACFALEGRYPQSYDYLQEHYGVHVDLKRYSVHYEIFAENMMPDITVSERMAAQ